MHASVPTLVSTIANFSRIRLKQLAQMLVLPGTVEPKGTYGTDYSHVRATSKCLLLLTRRERPTRSLIIRPLK